MTKSSITSGQKKQYKRFIEDAADKALAEVGLDKDGLQRLITNGGEFQADIVVSIKKHSISNQFADEEVSSSYAYPKEYKGSKPIEEQIKAIAKIFDLDAASALEYAKNLPPLESFVPADALEWTGWFAIPSVDAVAARFFPEVKDSTERYCRAVNLVLQKIGESRDFYNYREGQITPAYLRVHARTAHALDLIQGTQKGDILIVAAQLGMRHRGRSVRRAREVFADNEFGLGSLAVGSITLTHPERLVHWEELDMDCAGDEFSPDADGQFDRAPYFSFSGDRVKFYAYWVGCASDYCGSVSAFLPQ